MLKMSDKTFISSFGKIFRSAIALAVVAVLPEPLLAGPTLNSYGVVGLLDMPTAESADDAQLSLSGSYFGGTFKNTLTFQIAPRLSGSFRYSILRSPTYNTWDRSFDIRYQLRYESRYLPAIAIGLQDFIGTGLYASEYVAATKNITPSLKVTAGMGWGRLGSHNGFTNPLSSIFGPAFNTRAATIAGGGVPNSGQWFRGPAAFFGGVEWQTPMRGLTFKAEYSSDAYTLETVTHSFFTRRTPLNFGLNYRFRNGNQVAVNYMYGSQIGISGSFVLNPLQPQVRNSVGPAPLAILSRPDDQPRTTGWTAQQGGAGILRQNVAKLLAADGQQLEAFAVSATSVEVRYRNQRHENVAQSVGLVARVLTHTMPASVEYFVIVPVENGLPMAAFHMSRSDVEELENAPNGAAELLARTDIRDAGALPEGAAFAVGLYPKFSWALEPAFLVSFFDPDNPLRFDLAARLRASYEARPGLILSGSARKRIFGTLNTVTRVSNSTIRHVRSDYGLYDNAGDPVIEHLTAELFFKPGKNLYGRVSAGYLEQMYGGVSAEVLWRPVNSNFALGAELNYVKQRAFDQLLGFQSYEVMTGHFSGYWNMQNGFQAQVDVGRYLAGDYGATFALDRAFNNGWKVGAFFTLTNVPFSSFGEGSFDKGIRITIPVAWATGKPTKDVRQLELKPITRDGGARLSVRNRLYEVTSEYHGDRLKRRWGRFWR